MSSTRNTKKEVGPGQYEHSSFTKSGPSYSVRLKTTKLMNQSFTLSPGPGAYSLNSMIKSGGKTFGLKTSFGSNFGVNRSNEPGPGAFEVNHTAVLMRKPTYRIGSAKRMEHQKSNGVPAPGR